MPEWVTIFHNVFARTDGFMWRFDGFLFILGIGLTLTCVVCALFCFLINGFNISDVHRCKNSKLGLGFLLAGLLCVPLGNYTPIIVLLAVVGMLGYMLLLGVVRSIDSCRKIVG